MQPLIHGIFSLETPVENRVKFNDAIRLLRDYYNDLISKIPNSSAPIADGAPTIVEEAGGLEFKTTDEFWLYEIDFDFWTSLIKAFPEISVSLYYGSIFVGEKCGMLLSVDGRITDVRYEDGSLDAIEFSKGLNGMDGLGEESA